MMNNHLIERIDPLTGSGNLLAFLEVFTSRLDAPGQASFSLLMVDLNKFGTFNEEHGHHQGDAVLHWIGIVLQDTNMPVYRIGGDEFLVVFSEGLPAEREALARAVFNRLNLESAQFNWADPASVILIHFLEEKLEIADIWIAVSDALFDAKVYGDRGFLVNTYTHASAGNNYQLRVINTLTERLLEFANSLDTTHQLAYSDPITKLPNSLAAEIQLEQAIRQSHLAKTKFSILFIDGDNLRLYNTISYSEGDEMIRKLSVVLSQNLRPGDFIARWRSGDEFFVILPETNGEKAMMVGERLRSAVEKEAESWQFPVTVSIGTATYPAHGETSRALLNRVETAAKFAKENGKNQVVNS